MEKLPQSLIPIQTTRYKQTAHQNLAPGNNGHTRRTMPESLS